MARDHSSQHVMLTVLGKDPKPACYKLGEQETEARLAPIALLKLLPETDLPSCVLALCTQEAKEESWPLLKQDLPGYCQAKLVEVSSITAQDEVNTYLKHVTEALPGSATELTVDVTHGFRHFSFLTYMAVLYISQLRGMQIRGAYYGLLRKDAPSPFLNLRPLLELPNWIYALRTLDDTGSAMPMA